MTDTATKSVLEYGMDAIDQIISDGNFPDATELHHHLYNEDYFIIGYYNAEKFLDQYGAFQAIGKVQQYEQDNFGEVTTDLSDSEKVANMFAYIVGEEALNNCGTLQHEWDNGELSEDDLIAIKAELSDQLTTPKEA